MKRRFSVGLGLSTLVLAGLAVRSGGASQAPASGPGDLRRLFPRQADLFVERSGLARLTLGPEVLSSCKPDLSDLRIFDTAGKELPFVVDSGLAPVEGVEEKQSFEAKVLDVRRETLPVKDRLSRTVESYDIEVPPVSSLTGTWDLVFQADQPQFVRVAKVAVGGQGIGAPPSESAKAEGGASPEGDHTERGPVEGGNALLIEEATLFRLPGHREKTRLPLPPFSAGRVTVTIEGEEGGYLDPTFRFESARRFEVVERAVVPLEVISRGSVRGRTIVEIARPRGLVPDLLRLETTTGLFDRPVEVRDEGSGSNGAPLGRASLFRVRAVKPVEDLELELRAARGDRLLVEIADGDSPPLDDLAFTAVVRQPSLVFAIALPPEGSAGPAGAVFLGGGRAWRPRYDLASLLPAAGRVLEGERAGAAARLYDPAELGPARMGPLRPNLLSDNAPALAFAMRPGAAIDVRPYAERRPLDVPPSREGLVRLKLEPSDLALARPDLADVRIVDGENRQWPYLVEPDVDEEWLDLGIGAPARRGGVSRYVLALPVSPIEPDRLVLETGAPFFERAFRIEAVAASRDGGPEGRGKGKEKRTMAQGWLARRAEDPRPRAIALERARVESLVLEVTDGDDAPLAFESARVRVPVPLLYLAAPAGRYFLLVGNPETASPRYELARVREVVLAVASSPVRVNALEPNPDYSARARLAAGTGPETVVLWAVLAGAVIVLGILTLRLARREEAPPHEA